MSKQMLTLIAVLISCSQLTWAAKYECKNHPTDTVSDHRTFFDSVTETVGADFAYVNLSENTVWGPTSLSSFKFDRKTECMENVGNEDGFKVRSMECFRTYPNLGDWQSFTGRLVYRPDPDDVSVPSGWLSGIFKDNTGEQYFSSVLFNGCKRIN